jgi:hypothetical protein
MLPVSPTKREDYIPEATTILRRAIRLENQGYLHPSVLKRRLGAIGAIWLIGVAAVIASFVAITRGAASNGQQQVLFGFFLVLSLATLVAATLGLFLALWNAYVYQYILALAAKSETIDYLYDSVAEAALSLASDAEFRKQLASELVSLKAVSNVTAEELANATVVQLAEKAKSVAAGIEKD